MSALEVTDKVVEAILSKKYDSIILNFANPDMVGHSAISASLPSFNLTSFPTNTHGTGFVVWAVCGSPVL